MMQQTQQFKKRLPKSCQKKRGGHTKQQTPLITERSLRCATEGGRPPLTCPPSDQAPSVSRRVYLSLAKQAPVRCLTRITRSNCLPSRSILRCGETKISVLLVFWNHPEPKQAAVGVLCLTRATRKRGTSLASMSVLGPRSLWEVRTPPSQVMAPSTVPVRVVCPLTRFRPPKKLLDSRLLKLNIFPIEITIIVSKVYALKKVVLKNIPIDCVIKKV